jgi:hypothetical protein
MPSVATVAMPPGAVGSGCRAASDLNDVTKAGYDVRPKDRGQGRKYFRLCDAVAAEQPDHRQQRYYESCSWKWVDGVLL